VHGGGGHDFMDGTEEAFLGVMSSHLQHGTTTMLPSTVAAEEEELGEAFATCKRVRTNPDNRYLPELIGMHLEGPYLSLEMAGAQDPKYIKIPTDGRWTDIVKMADGELKIWTIAPELEGAEEMAAYLRKENIILSAGHSSARYEDVVKAIGCGYTMATHLYSGMSTIIREEGYRIPGLLEGSLLHDEICVEVIADGLHLPPALLKLIYKTKGKDRMVLITDAMRGAGMPDGEYFLGSKTNGQLVPVYDGIAHTADRTGFAGSVATADRLLRTVVQQADFPLHEAVTMITYNPAREIGIADRKGLVLPGYDADLVLFDENIQVSAVWRAGKKVIG